MAYEINEQPDAEAALDRLADDPQMGDVFEAIERTIGRLSEDPFSKKLGTRSFQTDELGYLSATPARADDWWLLWRRGGKPNSIALVFVVRLELD